MPQHSATLEIASAPDRVWTVLGEPERWLVGYRETTARSPDYPATSTENDHVYHTRVSENVSVRVSRSEPERLLEEEHEGKTYSRRLRYELEPTEAGTRLTLEDDIRFKGLARLATPIAFDDVKRRWKASLARLRETAETH